MRFKQYLLEAKISADELHSKYYSDIDKKIFDKIVKADPYTKVSGKTIIFVGKYSKILLKWHKQEKKPFVINTLKYLKQKLKYHKDNPKTVNYLDSYKNITEFYNEILALEDENKVLEKENPIVYDKGVWKIRALKTQQGSLHFGGKQGWCTSNEVNCYFNHYNREGDLYIFYKNDKVYSQLYINKKTKDTEFMYPKNKPLDIDDFIKEVTELKSWFKSVGIEPFEGIKYQGRKFSYTIEKDVLVFERLDLSDMGINSLSEFVLQFPFGITKYKVKGHFDCRENELVDLEDSPISVGGYYECCDNNLHTLKGCTKKIGSYFNCNNNSLTSLKYGPISLGGYYFCISNYLKTLAGSPKTIPNSFSCLGNQLKSLEGGPSSVGDNYICSHNALITLKGAPKHITGNFDCESNKLLGLEEGPKRVDGRYNCKRNTIKLDKPEDFNIPTFVN